MARDISGSRTVQEVSHCIKTEAIALCPVDLLEEGWYAFLLDTMRVAKKSNYEART